MLVYQYIPYSYIPTFLRSELLSRVAYVTRLPLIPWLHWFHQSRLLRTDSNLSQIPSKYLYYPVYKVRNRGEARLILIFAILSQRVVLLRPSSAALHTGLALPYGIVLADTERYLARSGRLTLTCSSYPECGSTLQLRPSRSIYRSHVSRTKGYPATKVFM